MTTTAPLESVLVAGEYRKIDPDGWCDWMGCWVFRVDGVPSCELDDGTIVTIPA